MSVCPLCRVLKWVFAIYAGCCEFKSHWRYMSNQFLPSNRPRKPQQVQLELQKGASGWGMVTEVSLNLCSGIGLIKPTEQYKCTQNTTQIEIMCLLFYTQGLCGLIEQAPTQGCHLSFISKFPDFSLIFQWHFTVFHTLWQLKKIFFTLMVLTISLLISGLLLKEIICSPWEQILSY